MGNTINAGMFHQEKEKLVYPKISFVPSKKNMVGLEIYQMIVIYIIKEYYLKIHQK